MALRDQPYLPLYIQDFLTDEKLAECSAQSTGVYIRIMCLMHKSEHYGMILLKQKHKQNLSKIKNFAAQLAAQMPFPIHVVEAGIEELLAEGVLILEDDFLVQKRMVKDFQLSTVRSKSGKKGGDKSKLTYSFATAKGEANKAANSEDENENESSSLGNSENSKVVDGEANDTIPVQQVSITQLLSIKDCLKFYFICKDYAITIEALCIRHSIYPDRLKEWAAAFAQELVSRGDNAKTLTEFAHHFSHWMKGRDTTKEPQGFFKKEAKTVVMLSPFGVEVNWTPEQYEQKKDKTEFKFLRHELG